MKAWGFLPTCLRNATFSRITFADTDLEVAMDRRNYILQAQRAMVRLLDQVLVE